jgi:hypothetical protein
MCDSAHDRRSSARDPCSHSMANDQDQAALRELLRIAIVRYRAAADAWDRTRMGQGRASRDRTMADELEERLRALEAEDVSTGQQ